MQRQRLTAKELQRSYRNGERNFANVDLSGESLRGMNLKGIDLSGADLSKTDIRGTNFINANLHGTQFVNAIAGIQHHWFIIHSLIMFGLIGLTGFSVGAFLSMATSTASLPGVLGIGLFSLALLLSYFRGLFLAFSSAAFINVFMFVTILFVIGSGESFSIFIFVLAFAISASILLFFACSWAVFMNVPEAIFIMTLIVFLILLYLSILPGEGNTLVVLGGVGINMTIGYSAGRRALDGDFRYKNIRDVAAWISSWGGTKFVRSNLMEASFEKSALRHAQLHMTKLCSTNFHLTRGLNSCRLGKTILANFSVQNLLTTLKGNRQSLFGLNLKGAYLAGADLADVDFTEADLSQATQSTGTKLWR